MVGVLGSGIKILRPPRDLTKEEALNLAGWLVTLADPGGEEFPKMLDAIQNGE